MKLYELTKSINVLSDKIDSGEFTQDELADTLDGLKLATRQKSLDITALVMNEEADIVALKEAEARIAQRRKTKQNKIDWLKKYLLDNMELSGIKKISCPEFEISLAKNPPKVELIEGAEVLLEAKYGDRFIRKKTTVSVDKKELKTALKEGEEIAGARLLQSNRVKFS